MTAKPKFLGTPVLLLRKAKYAGAYVRFTGVESKLLGTPVRFLWAKTKCAGHKRILLHTQASGSLVPWFHTL